MRRDLTWRLYGSTAAVWWYFYYLDISTKVQVSKKNIFLWLSYIYLYIHPSWTQITPQTSLILHWYFDLRVKVEKLLVLKYHKIRLFDFIHQFCNNKKTLYLNIVLIKEKKCTPEFVVCRFCSFKKISKLYFPCAYRKG